MDIKLVWHLLVVHPFAARLFKAFNAWKAIAFYLGNSQDSDGMLKFDVQVIGKKVTKKQLKLQSSNQSTIYHLRYNES